MRLLQGVAAITLTVATSAWATSAKAQTQAENATAAHSEETVEYEGPDRGLFLSGFFMFGVPYIASVGVAAGSSHPGDERLYVPFAGPWLDLNSRPQCRTNSIECDTETTNRVLLVGDGILQGLGALQILGSFIFPETRMVSASVPATALTPKMQISPAKVGPGAYGLSAVGVF